MPIQSELQRSRRLSTTAFVLEGEQSRQTMEYIAPALERQEGDNELTYIHVLMVCIGGNPDFGMAVRRGSWVSMKLVYLIMHRNMR